MRPASIVLLAVVALLVIPAALGQALIQPTVFTRPVALRAENTGQQPTEDQTPQQEGFVSGDIALPTGDKSQYGASSKVYRLSVFGFPKCTESDGKQTCVSRYWFQLSVDANVVNSIEGQVGTIREYIFSQKGSPLSVTLPAHTWTTQKGNVPQTWFAFSPIGSARFIPVTSTSTSTSSGAASGTTNSSFLTGGGTLSVGATAQANFQFDVTEPGTSPTGSDMTYPGMLYISGTPIIAATLGAPLKSAVFAGSPIKSWVWGTEYRVGFQFKGQKPVNISVTGTYSAKGLTASRNGVAISLSKIFGGIK